MKQFILLSVLTSLLLSNSDCSKKAKSTSRYKGKLEIAGICMNYTIAVIEGNMDAEMVVASWTDDISKKNYRNVFKLGNPCDFPTTIKQGDEFYFSIDTSANKTCAVCMAYYPTPEKAVSVKVVE
jgi:hypothetical protein